jgi:hypothetical protein
MHWHAWYRSLFWAPLWRCSSGAPKMPPKTRPTRILGSGPKLVHHRQAQNPTGARWIPHKQLGLPRWPLRGRTLSGASAPRDTMEKWPQARMTIVPSPRLPPFRTAAAGDDAPLSSSATPPLAKKSSLALRRFPAAVWLGFHRLHHGYQQRTQRRRPTPPARCSVVCLAGRYGQGRRAHDGGSARG